MWYLLYNLTWAALLVMAFPLLPLVALLGPRYREGLGQRFGFYPKAIRRELASKRPLWIHAASVGEVRSTERLVHELKARAPDRKLLLSTFTATGNRIAREIPGVDAAIYLPLDLPWIVGRTLRLFDPSMLVIIETEIWPNLLRGAFRRGVPAILLSGRLSARALARYALLRGLFRRVLECFTALGMQSVTDASRIAALGANEHKVHVVGNLKFAARSDDAGRAIVAAKNPARPVLVAGSTHRGEEEVVLQAFHRARERFPGLSLVLAPRHPERFVEAEKLLRGSAIAFGRKSRSAANEWFSRDVLLLDTVGELSDFFAAADIAFVGGSLVDIGGHNVLEPARLHKPIVFGPHMANFSAIAEELKRCGAAIEVRGADDFAGVLMDLLGNQDKCRRMGTLAAKVAAAQGDALALNLGLAQRYL